MKNTEIETTLWSYKQLQIFAIDECVFYICFVIWEKELTYVSFCFILYFDEEVET